MDKPENVEKIVVDYLSVEENQNKIRKQFFADNANNKYNECKKLLLEVYDFLAKVDFSMYKITYETDCIYCHLEIISNNCCNEAIEILNDTSSLENVKLKYYFQVLYNRSDSGSGIRYLLEKLGFKEQ